MVPGGGEKQQTPVVAPVGEFGSSDPDLSVSDRTESVFQFAFQRKMGLLNFHFDFPPV